MGYKNKLLDIFKLKIYRCMDSRIIYPFNEGFTLTQGTKDAMNAIYSLVIEPIDWSITDFQNEFTAFSAQV